MPDRAVQAAALVAVLAAVVLGAGLGGSALYEPDEARHAQIGREMLAAPSWSDRMVPRLDGAPYRNKPAPYYWLLAASFAAIGVDERAARLVSAIAGVVVAVAIARWGAAAWGARTGVLAGLVFLTAPQVVVLGRFATPDMLLAMWTTLGILAVHRFVERPGASLLPAAAAGAAGLLTKGAGAPALIALVGLATVVARGRMRLLAPRAVAPALAVFLAIALPWHLAVAGLDPAYLERLYLDQHWRRVVEAVPRLHGRPLLYYVPVLLAGFFPWSALLPATLRSTLAAGRRDPAVVFCALWAGTVLAVFSLAKGKAAAYILPAYPALALLTARAMGLWLAGGAAAGERTLIRAGLWTAAAVLAVLPGIATIAGARFYGGALFRVSLWSLLLLAPAALLLRLLRRDRLEAASMVLAASGALLLPAAAVVAAPAVLAVHSDATLARFIRDALPGHAAAPLVAYHVRSASLRFYLDRPVLLKENARQLRRLLAAHPLVLVVTSPRHVPELLAAGPFVPWRLGPRRVLYASQPPPAAGPPAP